MQSKRMELIGQKKTIAKQQKEIEKLQKKLEAETAARKKVQQEPDRIHQMFVVRAYRKVKRFKKKK